jgi:hypothetical protein
MKNSKKKNEYLKKYRQKSENKARHRETVRRWRERQKLGIKTAPKDVGTPKPPKTMAMRYREQRTFCLEKYGNKCVCCGESNVEFLAFDHIDGGGTQHRKKVGNITTWIVRNNFPDNIRILCHNCNQARGYYGYCPHTGSHLSQKQK